MTDLYDGFNYNTVMFMTYGAEIPAFNLAAS